MSIVFLNFVILHKRSGKMGGVFVQNDESPDQAMNIWATVHMFSGEKFGTLHKNKSRKIFLFVHFAENTAAYIRRRRAQINRLIKKRGRCSPSILARDTIVRPQESPNRNLLIPYYEITIWRIAIYCDRLVAPIVSQFVKYVFGELVCWYFSYAYFWHFCSLSFIFSIV